MLASTWSTISSRIGNTTDSYDCSACFPILKQPCRTWQTHRNPVQTCLQSNQSATSLVKEFHDLYNFTVSMRSDTDAQIAEGVDTVNAALRGIEEINGKIAKIDRDQRTGRRSHGRTRPAAGSDF
jgi:flagellar hook-associated protein 1 FlgK